MKTEQQIAGRADASIIKSEESSTVINALLVRLESTWEEIDKLKIEIVKNQRLLSHLGETAADTEKLFLRINNEIGSSIHADSFEEMLFERNKREDNHGSLGASFLLTMDEIYLSTLPEF